MGCSMKYSDVKVGKTRIYLFDNETDCWNEWLIVDMFVEYTNCLPQNIEENSSSYDVKLLLSRRMDYEFIDSKRKEYKLIKWAHGFYLKNKKMDNLVKEEMKLRKQINDMGMDFFSQLVE